MSGTIKFSDDTFQTDLDTDVPVLVDFWAEWCGPCRTVAPTLEEIATEFDGKIIVGKLNVDDNPQTTAAYGIRGIPTMIIFKNGEEIGKIVGAVPKTQIVDALNSVLGIN